jgi:hypothetical protein
MGQVLMNENATANTMSIDVTGLQSGLYFIEIAATDNTTQWQSFIKQ